MIALTKKKCKVENIGSTVDFENIQSRDTCALRETLTLWEMKCGKSALMKFLLANLFNLHVYSFMLPSQDQDKCKLKTIHWKV